MTEAVKRTTPFSPAARSSQPTSPHRATPRQTRAVRPGPKKTDRRAEWCGCKNQLPGANVPADSGISKQAYREDAVCEEPEQEMK